MSSCILVRTTYYGLGLLLRKRLGAIGLGIILGLGLGWVELGQAFARCGYVVPAAVLKIDQGLVVEVDRDNPPDNAGKAL